MSPLQEPGVSLEMSKVSFDADPNLSFGTFQYSLAAKFKLAGNMNFLFELPYVHYSQDVVYYPDSYYYYYYPTNSSSTVGNLYLGIESASPDGGPVFRFGVRLPLARESEYRACSYGIAAARDRWEAFWPHLTTLQFAGGFRASRINQYRLQTLLVPTVMIPDHGDPELFLDMNAEF